MALLAIFIGMLLLLHYTNCSTPPAAPDPEVLQYLTQLFEHVKESGRQPVHGELNLLPDESKGFANMVRCFPDSSSNPDQEPSSAMESKRALRFDLHGLKATDQIIEVRLVLKQSANAPEYIASVYEMTENGHRLKELDSHVYRGEWLDLEVHKVNDGSPMMTRGEYNLFLEISNTSSDLNTTQTLIDLKPMLLIYVYNENIYNQGGDSITESPSTKTTSTEEREDTKSKREAPSETLTDHHSDFEEMRRESCQLHSRNMTWKELMYKREERPFISLTSVPPIIGFTFCYGHCRTPRLRTEEQKYTPHAKVIGILNPDLGEAGLAPSCVPTSFNIISVVVVQDGSISTHALHIPTSCGCL